VGLELLAGGQSKKSCSWKHLQNCTHRETSPFQMQRHLPANIWMRGYCAGKLEIDFAPFLGVRCGKGGTYMIGIENN
jgi:hypothetical protein